MPHALEQLTVKSITLDETKLMKSLQVPRKNLRRYMSQARAITHLATHWVEQAFQILAEEDGNGLRLPHPHLYLRASIRSFSRGKIQFQQSKRMGVHRDPLSTVSDMLSDVEKVDFYFICDMRYFPRMDIYPIRAAKIMNFIHGHDVGKNGITPIQFDKFITENFDVTFQDYDHKEFMRRERRLNRLTRDTFPTVAQLKR